MIIAGEADIINVGILPEYRGNGIGNMLMDAMIDECKKNSVTCVHLEVRKSNSVAISLYEKYGFYRMRCCNRYSYESRRKRRLA